MTTTTAAASSSCTSFQLECWSINYHPFHHHDSSSHQGHSEPSNNRCNGSSSSSSSLEHPIEGILLAFIPIVKLFNGNIGGATPTGSDPYKAFMYETSSTSRTAVNDNNGMAKAARVALADYTIRSLTKLLSSSSNDGKIGSNELITLSTMEQAKHHHKQHHSEPSSSSTNVSQRMQQARQRKRNLLSLMRGKKEEVPFVLERSDCYVVDNNNNNNNNKGDDDSVELQFFLHVGCNSSNNTMQTPSSSSSSNIATVQDLLSNALQKVLPVLRTQLSSQECFSHIASVVLQRQLRSILLLLHFPG